MAISWSKLRTKPDVSVTGSLPQHFCCRAHYVCGHCCASPGGGAVWQSCRRTGAAEQSLRWARLDQSFAQAVLDILVVLETLKRKMQIRVVNGKEQQGFIFVPDNAVSFWSQINRSFTKIIQIANLPKVYATTARFLVVVQRTNLTVLHRHIKRTSP